MRPLCSCSAARVHGCCGGAQRRRQGKGERLNDVVCASGFLFSSPFLNSLLLRHVAHSRALRSLHICRGALLFLHCPVHFVSKPARQRQQTSLLPHLSPSPSPSPAHLPLLS